MITGSLVDGDVVSEREHVGHVVTTGNGDFHLLVTRNLTLYDPHSVIFRLDGHEAEVKDKVNHELTVVVSQRDHHVGIEATDILE